MFTMEADVGEIEERLGIVEVKYDSLRETITEMKDAVKSIDRSLHELSMISQKSSDNYESLKRFYQIVEKNSEQITIVVKRIDGIDSELELRADRLKRLEDSDKNSNKKIWRVIELLIAGAIGYVINLGVKK